MELNNPLNINQHGFRKQGRSCVTQLLGVLDEWSNIMKETNQLDIIYLDFRKEFDKVHHKRLLLKLKTHAISQTIINWVEKFLSGRKQP